MVSLVGPHLRDLEDAGGGGEMPDSPQTGRCWVSQEQMWEGGKQSTAQTPG